MDEAGPSQAAAAASGGNASRPNCKSEKEVTLPQNTLRNKKRRTTPSLGSTFVQAEKDSLLGIVLTRTTLLSCI